MVNTKVYFHNIREEIHKEISLANKSILVAVAWFTDRYLFDALLESLKKGRQVEVCIVKDDINLGEHALPWEQFKIAGGKLFVKSDTLMHNKFCIIDGSEVINGSYNWTLKASQSNEENILITSGDYEIVSDFINQFKQLTGQQKETIIRAEIGKIIKRLKLIINLVELEDKDDISKHASKLKAETDNEEIINISSHLLNGEYQEAIQAINIFISNNSGIITYEDPAIIALQMEIKMLEYEIVALDNEKTDCEKILRNFELLMQRIVGDLLNEILRAKRDYAHRHRKESTYSESEYQESKRRYDEQAKQREEAEKEERITIAISEEEKMDLKKIYRHASMLCHPDKVSIENKYDAENMFKKLHDAYLRQDVVTAKAIYEQLRQGLFSFETKKYQIRNY